MFHRPVRMGLAVQMAVRERPIASARSAVKMWPPVHHRLYSGKEWFMASISKADNGKSRTLRPSRAIPIAFGPKDLSYTVPLRCVVPMVLARGQMLREMPPGNVIEFAGARCRLRGQQGTPAPVRACEIGQAFHSR